VICIVEAMKMENEVHAHTGGVVTDLRVTAGQGVTGGETVCRIVPE
jgi:biotin carboxyl carrier protein